MDWIFVIIVGALVGWIASLVMRTDKQQGAIANILIGIVGATLGRWLFANVLGIDGATTAGTLSLAGVFWGVVGSVLLIAVLKMLNIFGHR